MHTLSIFCFKLPNLKYYLLNFYYSYDEIAMPETGKVRLTHNTYSNVVNVYCAYISVCVVMQHKPW